MLRTGIFLTRYIELNKMREFVQQAALDAGLDENDSYEVQLAVDEACTNIIEHACGGECDEQIEITCTQNKDQFVIVIHDHGEPFDPTSAPIPDLSSGVYDRPIGGLGIFLMRKLMDEVHFESQGERGNFLTLIKNPKKVK